MSARCLGVNIWTQARRAWPIAHCLLEWSSKSHSGYAVDKSLITFPNGTGNVYRYEENLSIYIKSCPWLDNGERN